MDKNTGKNTANRLMKEIVFPQRGKLHVHYIPVDGKIPGLIDRLSSRYLETAHRYQRLDKRFRESIPILRQGKDYRPRKIKK
ncbi:MAG: hypothetical protein ACE5I8_04555 [Thermodesulfobacteriota bacterium]